MPYQEGLSQWHSLLSSRLPHLSRPQLRILSYWSFALVLSKRMGITWESQVLASLFAGKADAWRQSLREWCYDAEDKKGEHRQALDVSQCFACLLAWVLAWWDPQDHRLHLAVDATSLGQRFHILTVSVLYRHHAIPVAWQVRGSRERGAWEPIWEQLLSQLKPAVPEPWMVLVSCDRGITGAQLFTHIVSLGWHPFLRLTRRGTVRVQGQDHYQPLSTLLQEQGIGWGGAVCCYATVQLTCTLLSGQGQGQKEPWIVITDLSVQEAKLGWYQMRFWIECGFKELKSRGYGWQHSKMTQPSRMQRYILVMAVSTLWELSQAYKAETAMTACDGGDRSQEPCGQQKAKGRSAHRELSQASLGRIAILCMQLKGEWQMQGQFPRFEWPEELPASTRKRGPNKRHRGGKAGMKRCRRRRSVDKKAA